MTVLPGGDLIVGGEFTTAGGIAASYIARYNPTTGVWSRLGSGANGFVRALTVLQGGDVIVGGDFTTAGGVAASRIARYNPTTGVWSPLGSGVSGSLFKVSGLAVLPGGDLIVCGDFTTAGGVLADRIARYNPTTGAWSALGSGVRIGSVSGLAVLPDGDVIVGGNFSTAGGVAANSIARYRPTTGTWSALGSGVQGTFGGYVDALAVLAGGDVIAGGYFTIAGGQPANSIARYNPTTGAWSSLGSGVGSGVFNGTVQALAVLPGSDVIAGGGFTTAGGVSVSNITRYNPTTGAWSPLGSRVNDGLWALAALPGGDVIAGGTFTTAGGLTENYFARYTFGSPAPSITAQPQPVTACRAGSASFSVTAAGTAPFTYSWRHSGFPINPASNPSAATATLVLTNVSAADAGSYDCVISNACGSVTSNAATLTVCVANTDDGSGTGVCDGGVTIDDLLYYLNIFDQCLLRADVDDGTGSGTPDGGVTIDDLLYYLARFDAGC